MCICWACIMCCCCGWLNRQNWFPLVVVDLKKRNDSRDCTCIGIPGIGMALPGNGPPGCPGCGIFIGPAPIIPACGAPIGAIWIDESNLLYFFSIKILKNRQIRCCQRTHLWWYWRLLRWRMWHVLWLCIRQHILPSFDAFIVFLYHFVFAIDFPSQIQILFLQHQLWPQHRQQKSFLYEKRLHLTRQINEFHCGQIDFHANFILFHTSRCLLLGERMHTFLSRRKFINSKNKIEIELTRFETHLKRLFEFVDQISRTIRCWCHFFKLTQTNKMSTKPKKWTKRKQLSLVSWFYWIEIKVCICVFLFVLELLIRCHHDYNRLIANRNWYWILSQ